MLNRLRTNAFPSMRPDPRHAISSLPSRHYKYRFWCVDGPFNGQRLDYRGKHVRVRVYLKPLGGNPGRPDEKTPISGEYQHTWRHLGNKQGYEHFYQWHGLEV